MIGMPTDEVVLTIELDLWKVVAGAHIICGGGPSRPGGCASPGAPPSRPWPIPVSIRVAHVELLLCKGI